MHGEKKKVGDVRENSVHVWMSGFRRVWYEGMWCSGGVVMGRV